MKNTKFKENEPMIKERGSTLIEVLIATAIFAFMMLGLAAAFSLIMKNNSAAKHQTDCATRAQQVAEILELDWNIAKESGAPPALWPTLAVGATTDITAGDMFWNDPSYFPLYDDHFDIQYALTASPVAGEWNQLDVIVQDKPTVTGGTKPKYPGTRIREARYTTFLQP